MINRRHLLVGSAGALAAAAIPRPAQSQRRLRVVVIGAGAAGLSAAWELHHSGHDVRVFEAADRPGGRMRTVREPFDDGLYAEAGALNLTAPSPGIEYARELGLELRPLAFEADLGSLVHFRGHRLVEMPGEPVAWPLDLHEDEQGLTLSALQTKYYRRPVAALGGVGRLERAGSPGPGFRRLDETSLGAFWELQGASPDAIDLMSQRYFAGYGPNAHETSLLQIAREMASFAKIKGAFRVSGGNDLICSRMAERLGERVHLQSRVLAVSTDDGAAGVVVERNGVRESVESDYVVLTAPPPVLRRLPMTPALPPAVMNAIDQLMTVPVTRVFLQARTRFWRDRRLNGTAITDLPVGMITESTGLQEGPRAILESFTYNERAAAMAALPPEERQRVVRDAVATLYPGGVDLEPPGTSVSWADDPFIRCGHVAFRPGQMIETLRLLREPHGRIHFAGDTVGGIPGYSHAAFESGRDVVARILAVDGARETG